MSHTSAADKAGDKGVRRPSVLIVAADSYVLRACERHDVEAVLLCNSSAYDGGRLRPPPRTTVIRVDDVTSAEDCLGALYRAGMADRQFDGIMTTWEFSAVTVAVLGPVLGCRVIDPVTALHFRDKSLQKTRLARMGVPVTRSVVIPDIYDVSDVPLEFERAVLKPISGAGTASTSIVCERKDLEDASHAARRAGQANRTFLLEEFVDGDEWMADGVVFDGEVVFFGLGAYTTPCLEAVNSQVPLSLRRLDPAQDAQAYESAEPVVRGAIAALGLRDGVFHMELFCERHSGRIVFGECAARRGGALIQEQVLAKFNVDLAEAALLCAIGRRPDIEVKVHPKVIGIAGFYGQAGTVVSYPTPDEMLCQPNVRFAHVWVPPGGSLSTKFAAATDMLGALLLFTDSVTEFDQRVTELRDWFSERLAVVEPGLNSGQRWTWQRKHWPERDYRHWLYEGE